MHLRRIRRVLLLLCCCILAVLLANFLTFSPVPIQPGVSFLGFTNSGTDLLARFSISNASTRPVDYCLCPIQIKSNNYSPHPLPATGPPNRILPGQVAVCLVNPPDNEATWRVPIEWVQLPTRSEVLWYHVRCRFDLFRQGNGFAPGPRMYVQGYTLFTADLSLEGSKGDTNLIGEPNTRD
jgi:hypothetical protein